MGGIKEIRREAKAGIIELKMKKMIAAAEVMELSPYLPILLQLDFEVESAHAVSAPQT